MPLRATAPNSTAPDQRGGVSTELWLYVPLHLILQPQTNTGVRGMFTGHVHSNANDQLAVVAIANKYQLSLTDGIVL